MKEEPAASDGPPPAGVGSSDSDSSGVLNDTDMGATGATPAAEAPEGFLQASAPAGAHPSAAALRAAAGAGSVVAAAALALLL